MTLVAGLCIAGCSCPTEEVVRSFPIDASQAAEVLDEQGRPIAAQCRVLCRDLNDAGEAAFWASRDASAGDAAPRDASATDAGVRDAGLQLLPSDFDRDYAACEVISDGAQLEARCRWVRTILCWG